MYPFEKSLERVVREESKVLSRLVKDEQKEESEEVSEKTDPYLHEVLNASTILAIIILSC